MSINLANLDLGGIFSGIGNLAKSIRIAITGKEPISAEKAAEIALKIQELESNIEQSRISVMIAEASSQDKWTSRARPSFLYVMYIMILTAFPMGILYAYSPVTAKDVTVGVTEWLKAIPEPMWMLFGAGYLGYVGARSYDKRKNRK